MPQCTLFAKVHISGGGVSIHHKAHTPKKRILFVIE